MIYIIIALLIIGFIIFKKFFKLPKVGNLVFTTGGVKSGKTLFSIYLCYKRYRKNVMDTKIANFFRKLLKKELIEMPLFYSTIPVGFDYVPLDSDILMFKKRVVPNSVIFVDEASLFADSQLIKNVDLNNSLLLFNKLCAHFGVSLLCYNSQSLADCHYSIKRSLSNYFYVHHSRRFLLLPFVVLYLQEYRYSDDGSVISITGDKYLEKSLLRVIIRKKYFKLYDSHCYFKIVEDLEEKKDVINMEDVKDLKCDNIVSFRKEFNQLINKIDNQPIKINYEVVKDEKN